MRSKTRIMKLYIAGPSLEALRASRLASRAGDIGITVPAHLKRLERELMRLSRSASPLGGPARTYNWRGTAYMSFKARPSTMREWGAWDWRPGEIVASGDSAVDGFEAHLPLADEAVIKRDANGEWPAPEDTEGGA